MCGLLLLLLDLFGLGGGVQGLERAARALEWTRGRALYGLLLLLLPNTWRGGGSVQGFLRFAPVISDHVGGRCRALYGLLMLLPQSNAFKMLQARLHSVPVAVLLQLEATAPPGTQRGQSRASGSGRDAPATSPQWQHIDFNPFLEIFRERQVRRRQLDEQCFSILDLPCVLGEGHAQVSL